jgi:hypothetical protein
MLPDQSRLAAAVEQMVNAEARRQDQMAAVADALTMLAGKVGDTDLPAGEGDAATETEPEPEPEVPNEDVLELETEAGSDEDDEDDILELDDEVDDAPVAEIPPKPTPIPAMGGTDATDEMAAEAGPAEEPGEPADALAGAPKPRPIFAPTLDKADDDVGAQNASGTDEEAEAEETAPTPKPVFAEAGAEETTGDDTGEAAEAGADDEAQAMAEDETAEDEAVDVSAEPEAEAEDEASEPEAEDEETSEDDEERMSSAAATASWIASGRRDHADEVVANIRARSVNRTPDDEAGEEPGKRGLLGRLFRRS